MAPNSGAYLYLRDTTFQGDPLMTRSSSAESKKASSPEATEKGSDAIALLKKDHKTVRELLEEFEKATAPNRRAQLFEKINEELKAHTTVEEEIFYPAYRDAATKKEDRKLFFEAAEEHGLVDQVLAQLRAGNPASDSYAAKAKVLKDLVEHHAEEEEDEMFPRARKLLDKSQLLELGAKIEARKAKL